MFFFFSKKEIILIANRLFLILNSYFLIFYNGYDEFPAVGNENKRKR